jgi:hypothetical protein
MVEMRYFGGYSDKEIAETLDITERTVQRDWDKARMLLRVDPDRPEHGARHELSIEQLRRMSRLLDEVDRSRRGGRRAWLQALPRAPRPRARAARRRCCRSPAAAARCRRCPSSGRLGGRGRPAARRPRGPYRLLHPLGAGGMAEVWLAERADGAFKRRVALKMPARLEAREDLARRFAVERDILAGLEHPHIARFYDAGVSEGGHPYLALEYVPGRNLLAWADEQRLPCASASSSSCRSSRPCSTPTTRACCTATSSRQRAGDRSRARSTCWTSASPA